MTSSKWRLHSGDTAPVDVWQSSRYDRRIGNSVLLRDGAKRWTPLHRHRLYEVDASNTIVFQPLQFTARSTPAVDKLVEEAYRLLHMGELDANALTRVLLGHQASVPRRLAAAKQALLNGSATQWLVGLLSQHGLSFAISRQSTWTGVEAIIDSTDVFFFDGPPHFIIKMPCMVARHANVLLAPKCLDSEIIQQTVAALRVDYEVDAGLADVEWHQLECNVTQLFHEDGRFSALFLDTVLASAMRAAINMKDVKYGENFVPRPLPPSATPVSAMVIYARQSTEAQATVLSLPIGRQVWSLIVAAAQFGLLPQDVHVIIEVASSGTLPFGSRPAVTQHLARLRAQHGPALKVLTTNPDRLTRRAGEVQGFATAFTWLSTGLHDIQQQLVHVTDSYLPVVQDRLRVSRHVSLQHGLYARYHIAYARLLHVVKQKYASKILMTSQPMQVTALARVSPTFANIKSSSLNTQEALLKVCLGHCLVGTVQRLDGVSIWSSDGHDLILRLLQDHSGTNSSTQQVVAVCSLDRLVRKLAHLLAVVKACASGEVDVLVLFWPVRVAAAAAVANVQSVAHIDDCAAYLSGVDDRVVDRLNPVFFPLLLSQAMTGPVGLRNAIEQQLRDAECFVEGFQLSSYQGQQGPLPIDLRPARADNRTRGITKDDSRRLCGLVKKQWPDASVSTTVITGQETARHCLCKINPEHHVASDCWCLCKTCRPSHACPGVCTPERCNCPHWCPCTCEDCHRTGNWRPGTVAPVIVSRRLEGRPTKRPLPATFDELCERTVKRQDMTKPVCVNPACSRPAQHGKSWCGLKCYRLDERITIATLCSTPACPNDVMPGAGTKCNTCLKRKAP